MLHGEHGHGGVEAVVGERQGLRGGAHAGRGARRPRRDHGGRRLDRGDLEVGGLVRAQAGAHVDHGARVAERGANAPRDARVGLPGASVGGAHVFVADRLPAQLGAHRVSVAEPPRVAGLICSVRTTSSATARLRVRSPGGLTLNVSW